MNPFFDTILSLFLFLVLGNQGWTAVSRSNEVIETQYNGITQNLGVSADQPYVYFLAPGNNGSTLGRRALLMTFSSIFFCLHLGEESFTYDFFIHFFVSLVQVFSVFGIELSEIFAVLPSTSNSSIFILFL